MIAVFLVFAGISLFVNGVWMLSDSGTGDPGRSVAGRDIAIGNLFAALIGFAMIVVVIANGQGSNEYDYSIAAYIGLFSLTYLWLGINQFTGVDGAGLGWFSLLVPFLAIPAGITALGAAASAFELWLAIDWFAWAILWFLFFVLLALKRPIARPVAVLTIAQALLTALLPAALLFAGVIGFS